jgi:hypothetical protein
VTTPAGEGQALSVVETTMETTDNIIPRLAELRDREHHLVSELADITSQVGFLASRVEGISGRLRTVRREIRKALDVQAGAAA